MSNEIKITLQNDNRKQIIDLVNANIAKALEECGMVAETYASRKLTAELNATPPSDWYVRTGALRNSIGHIVDVDNKKMILGAGEKYAPYVEFGTGIYYEGGRRTSWVYIGSDGKFHMTKGMQPRPFIKPALADHIDTYKRILINNLK